MENKTEEKIKLLDDDTSKLITAIRFPLMILIVFIHNNVRYMNYRGTIVSIAEPTYQILIHNFFSEILGRAAVPLFFFISAYLIFVKNDSYRDLINKKVKSLLLPYILWNIITVLFWMLIESVPQLTQFASDRVTTKTLDIKQWIQNFIGVVEINKNEYFCIGGGGYELIGPILGQLWFVRDLFIFVMISPLVKKAIQHSPLFYLVAIVLLYESSFLYPYLRTSIFFCSLAGYAVKFNLNCGSLEKLNFFDILFLFVIIVCINFFYVLTNISIPHFISLLTIFVSSIFLFKFIEILSKHDKPYNILKYLSVFSFWLFLTHIPFIERPLTRLWVKFLPMNGIFSTIEYFVVVILTVAISLGMGILLKKIVPKVFALLTGGR